MDFSKLTKQELIDLVTQQQTLNDAVQSKDKEIIQLKKQIQELNVKEKELVPRQQVNQMNDRIFELERLLKEQVPKDEVKRITQQMEEDLKKARQVANLYIQSHRDLMRVLKVNLDIAIAHEELLTEKIKKGE